MGGQQSKLKQLKIDNQKWTKVPSNCLQYEIVRNNQGKQGQKYHIVLDQSKDIDKQADLYLYRAKNNSNLVKILGAETVTQSLGFCGKSNIANVLTQRIPTLLSDQRVLNFYESNIVLYNALKGYSQISKKFGPIQITDKMIGFTPEGEIRVWINQKFGNNYPQEVTQNQKGEISHVKQNKSQKDMVNDLIRIIQNKTEKGGYPEPYRSSLYQKQTLSECIEFIISSKIFSADLLNYNKINLSSGVYDFMMKRNSSGQGALRETPQFGQGTYLSPRSKAKVTFTYLSPEQK